MMIISERMLAGSLLFGGTLLTWAHKPVGQDTGSSTQTERSTQVTVPDRPSNPLFKSEQGAQASEIKFIPVTRQVTIKLHVEDPNGYFLPNLRPDNFAVYEDGVRQKEGSAEANHAQGTV